MIEPNLLRGESADDEARGIALCRTGEWDLGVSVLARCAAEGARLSSHGFSYLGYGLAHRRRQVREGLRLCDHAVKLEFYQPDNQLNLARTLVLAGDRRRAMEAVRRGLAIDREHSELRALAEELGERRPPVLGFLSRGHFLNVILGKIRHAIKS